MRGNFRTAVLRYAAVAGLCAAMAAAAAAQAADPVCDTHCLKGMLERYENAVLKHDPAGLPTAAAFRATQNYRPMRLGEGYWKDISKIYYQFQFADPVTSQAVAVGMLDQGGRGGYYSLRLKIEGRRISQAEMFIVRKGEATFFESDPNQRIGAIYEQQVPVAGRSTRNELLNIADSFNDSWQYRNEDLTAFAPDCDFYENNVKLNMPGGPAGDTCGGMVEYGGKNGVAGAGKAGNGQGQRPPGQAANAGGSPSGGPRRVLRPADPVIGRPQLFGTQMWMRDRRYPVVDVARGVVFGYAIQGGEPARPGAAVVYEQPVRPSGAAAGPGRGAAYMFFLCKIVNGQIVRVDHFEREGGPDASGGFADGPPH